MPLAKLGSCFLLVSKTANIPNNSSPINNIQRKRSHMPKLTIQASIIKMLSFIGYKLSSTPRTKQLPTSTLLLGPTQQIAAKHQRLCLLHHISRHHRLSRNTIPRSLTHIYPHSTLSILQPLSQHPHHPIQLTSPLPNILRSPHPLQQESISQ